MPGLGDRSRLANWHGSEQGIPQLQGREIRHITAGIGAAVFSAVVASGGGGAAGLGFQGHDLLHQLRLGLAAIEIHALDARAELHDLGLGHRLEVGGL